MASQKGAFVTLSNISKWTGRLGGPSLLAPASASHGGVSQGSPLKRENHGTVPLAEQRSGLSWSPCVTMGLAHGRPSTLNQRLDNGISRKPGVEACSPCSSGSRRARVHWALGFITVSEYLLEARHRESQGQMRSSLCCWPRL